MTTYQAACFGKLPLMADFIGHNATGPESRGLDQFLQEGIVHAQSKLGEDGWQQAYEEAVDRVFSALDRLEQRLAQHDWLVGRQLTATDIRAFVTLARFELAYHDLFRCNLRPLSAYPAVCRYVDRLLAIPAFAASLRPEHIKAGYYSIARLNPTGIVPKGPALETTALRRFARAG